MAHTISRRENVNGCNAAAKNHSLVTLFTDWCTAQDKDHPVAWTGVSLIATAAVLFPITMVVTVLTGASFQLIITAMVSLVLVIVLNLAAMPARYTIPAFVLGIMIDTGVIVASLQVH